MRFDIVTLSPSFFDGLADYGVLGRALRDGTIRLKTWDLRQFAEGPHRRVDDRPYGGGPGMVLLAEPLWQAIEAVRQEAPVDAPVVFLSPQGQLLKQHLVEDLARRPGLILVCGRYEGVDERWVDAQVDLEISIGDFVLTGGEIPAMALVDAVSRWVPGTLGDRVSAVFESFREGRLDAPSYTRPERWRGRAVPQVLLDGHHEAIRHWRELESAQRTRSRRPDLLEQGARMESFGAPLGKSEKERHN
ncbi:tRNA (guanine-N1)-methyltransferase [mine drainage metagenome]|uniref:tRNA (guanine-N(1)-)-methyltransferase n=1 Tax=mine drainage metagenome TaxID=410659 RepID=T1C2A7_9ZZZZ